jgi:hypothetical protein
VYLDSNSHLNWPFASHDKTFLVLYGQLELGKPEPPDSQTRMSGLAVPGFRYIQPTLWIDAVFFRMC